MSDNDAISGLAAISRSAVISAVSPPKLNSGCFSACAEQWPDGPWSCIGAGSNDFPLAAMPLLADGYLQPTGIYVLGDPSAKDFLEPGQRYMPPRSGAALGSASSFHSNT